MKRSSILLNLIVVFLLSVQSVKSVCAQGFLLEESERFGLEASAAFGRSDQFGIIPHFTFFGSFTLRMDLGYLDFENSELRGLLFSPQGQIILMKAKHYRKLGIVGEGFYENITYVRKGSTNTSTDVSYLGGLIYSKLFLSSHLDVFPAISGGWRLFKNASKSQSAFTLEIHSNFKSGDLYFEPTVTFIESKFSRAGIRLGFFF